MGVRDSTGALENLYAANTPDAFWRLLIATARVLS